VPGTLDVVLTYPLPRWLWVEVRDASGRPITTGKVSGVRVEGDTDRVLDRCHSTLGPDGRGRLRDPGEPVLVRVEAQGFRNLMLGPFEPERFPDPLVVTLEHAPAMVGTVRRSDGAAAGGARITLHQDAPESQFLTHASWQGSGEPFIYHIQTRDRSE